MIQHLPRKLVEDVDQPVIGAKSGYLQEPLLIMSKRQI